MKLRHHRTLIASSIAVGILLISGAFYLSYSLGLRPLSSSGQSQSFTVKPGQNAPTIAQNLADAHLLRSRNSFVTYVNLFGLRSRLKAGQYTISPTLSGDQIAEILAGGRTATHRLIIPEGYRISQIETAAGNFGISKTAFNAALAEPHTQAFLNSKPTNIGLEGFLFPDSYQIDTTTTASGLVNAMLNTFGTRVGPEYTQAYATEGLTLLQGLTMSSIVEREVNNEADRPIVAQIFLKRLRLGQTLGSDVTAQYASDLLSIPFSVEANSPYNTRRFVGLPPGPICSPGLGSMDAVAHPASTDYLYFLSGKDGKTYFAKTYAEHQSNIAKYL